MRVKFQISEFLTNPLEGLFASIVVTSVRKSLLSNLTTRSIRLFVRLLKQNVVSISTSKLAALHSFFIHDNVVLSVDVIAIFTTVI